MQEGRVYLTNLGRRLLAKGQAGNSLHFTKFVIGDGIIESVSELLTMTELKSKKLEVGFRENAVKLNDDGTATIKVIVTNDNNSEWINMSEFGVYAQDPDLGEVLYAVGSNGTHPDPIPPKNIQLWDMCINVIVMVGMLKTSLLLLTDL